jgi:heme/copper-type cytochrome/quinol oxidase subunit 2
MSRVTRAVRITFVVGGLGTALMTPSPGVAQNQGPTPRPFSVAAKRYKFEPARIEVFQDDLVAITLRTEDIAHSFTIDEYRIAKRVGPLRAVSFEFRADRPGSFPFYCNLQTEDGCRQMRGELVVKKRSTTQR